MDNNNSNNQENNGVQFNESNRINNQNNDQQIIQFENSINPNNNQNNITNNVSNSNNYELNNSTINNGINNNSQLNNYNQNNITNNVSNSNNYDLNNSTINNGINNNNSQLNNYNQNNTINNPGQNIENFDNTLKTNPNNETSTKPKKDSFEKIASDLNIDFLVLGILSFLAFGYLLSQKTFKVNYIIQLAILIIGYVGSKDKKPYAASCGIISGVLMILSFSIIDMLLGIFLIIRSAKYNKKIKESGVKTKTLLYTILCIAVIFIVTVIEVYLNLIGGHTLKCTRTNGDKIEVRFNEEGITSVKMNGNTDNLKLSTYKLLFYTDFYLNKLDDTKNSYEKTKTYRNIVKKYEEENGAVCK